MSNFNELQPYQKFGVYALIFVLAGFVGWVHEYIFYFFNYGMEKFYMQGGNFLPWMNIYAFGAVILVFLASHLKKPLAVFVTSFVTGGTVEYIGGWLVYTMMDGKRFWDYNSEILNFGNIDGFVCFRSVFLFGLAGLLVTYQIVPLFTKLARRLSKKAFLTLSITLLTIVLADEIYNLVAQNVGWVWSHDFYTGLGLEYHE